MAIDFPSPNSGPAPALDAPRLRRAGRRLSTPFELMLDAPQRQQALLCTDLLRLLPQKRLVCFAIWQTRLAVVAKIFLDPHRAQKHCRREVIGLEALQAAEIPTPVVLFRGTLADGRTPLILTRRIPEARSLADVLASDDGLRAGYQQLTAVIQTLARMHAAGLSQRDIHPGNFLLANGEVLVVDGADIKRHARSPVPEAPSLANLGLFLAQFYPQIAPFLPELVAGYSRCRNWRRSDSRHQRALKAVQRWGDRRERKFLQKSLRPCTAFMARKSWRRFMVCDRSQYTATLQGLLDNPDAALQTGELLKAGNSATVVKIDLEGRALVVKRYNLKNRRHALGRALRATRACLSWRNANRLRLLKIATPRPIALLEERWGPIRRQAYFIAEFITGEPLKSFIEGHGDNAEALERCADRLVQLLKQMHQLRIGHGDLKASNFILAEERLYLLDLDGMRKFKREAPFERAFQRDVRRLLKNWPRSSVFATLLEARLGEVYRHG